MATKHIEADLCVVGSGVAGAIVAGQLAPKQRVVILERGKRTTFEQSVQRVEEGKQPYVGTPLEPEVVNVGKHVHPLSALAAVGGSTLHWWGNTPRFSPIDFKLASTHGVGVDWPIEWNEIEPYYGLAEEALGIAGSDEDAPHPRSRKYPLPAQPLSPYDEVLASALLPLGVRVKHMPMARPSRAVGARPACCGSGTCAPFCPSGAKYTALATHLREAEARGAIVIESLRANALVAGKSRIERVIARDLAGNDVEVHARRFVVAANAAETPRLLLLSALRDPSFRTSDAVGRYFMDHPYLEMHGVSPRDLRRGYGPTPSNATSYDFYDGPHRSERAAAIFEMMNWRVRPGEVAAATVSALRRGARGADVTGPKAQTWRGAYEVGFQMELLPSPDNRITLHATRRDVHDLPLPQVSVDMWPPYVEKTAEVCRALGKRLASSLGGTLEFRERHFSYHLLGTCRMGSTLETSVVDRDLRHHAYENLFLVGGSVFPTSSPSNPTLLIAALAIRAAHRLAAEA